MNNDAFLNNNYWKRFKICMSLFVKRLLQKPSFIVLLLLLPCFALGLHYMVSNTRISLQVGLYTEDAEGTYDDVIIERLTTNTQGLQFVLYDSMDELLKQVRTRGVDCAFVFPEYFSSNIEMEEKKNIIICYSSPGSATVSIAKEYMHSEIFTIYAFEKLVEYIYSDTIKTDSILEQNKTLAELSEKLSPIYEEHLQGDDTFSFTYVQADNTEMDASTALPSYILGSAKGIAAIFILAGALMGTLNLYQDKKNKLFLAFSKGTDIWAQFGDILIPTLLVGCSGLVTIWICDGFSIWAIFKTILYCILCAVYCSILHLLMTNKRIFIGMIPILLIGSFIFCPIVVDFAEIVPAIRPIRWCFPPQYFL